MAEYIERELAIEALSRGEGCENVCRRAIERILSADVVPVRHGRWIDCKEDPNEKYCSVCNHERNACNSWWNYCPNCGAKMDGGAD